LARAIPFVLGCSPAFLLRAVSLPMFTMYGSIV